MNIAIVQFPGSNCERETIFAVRRTGMDPIPFLWNESVTKLSSCDGCIIVGGFSYEDRGRAGIIASMDPILQIISQMGKQGKPILGICNGAQILVESGLVPGVSNNEVVMALARNKRVKNDQILGIDFYNDWVFIKTDKNYGDNAFLSLLPPHQPIPIPVAHGEGRFVLAEGLYDRLQQRNVGLMQYCDAKGKVYDDFPTNPNGSEYNLAAVCNARGNVMAIMPHPERTLIGDIIFKSMKRYIEENKGTNDFAPLLFHSPKLEVLPYHPLNDSLQIVVESIITDNAAASVQKALRNLGIKVDLERQIHWEITYEGHDKQSLKQKLIKSFELFNTNKERLVQSLEGENLHTMSFLIREREDLIGKHKYEILTKHFGIKNILNIKRGTLWHIRSKENDLESTVTVIMDKRILFNPCAQFCYAFSPIHS